MNENTIPFGPLGLHVALYRLIRRVMADDGVHHIRDVEVAAGDQYARIAKGVIHEATGERVRNFHEASTAQLEQALALLARQSRATLTRPAPWYPDGWEAAQHMGLSIARPQEVEA